MRKQIHLLLILLSFMFVLTACGGDDEGEAKTGGESVAVAADSAAPAGDAVHGEQLFMASCVACHGADAKGVAGLGKSLHAGDSDFVRQSGDTELVEFIKVGRQPGEPLNTTGVAMPPKGGNPAISDADLYDIVAWIRTLE